MTMYPGIKRKDGVVDLLWRVKPGETIPLREGEEMVWVRCDALPVEPADIAGVYPYAVKLAETHPHA